MPDKYPYKLAKLKHHNHDMSKRWYILFYAWDVSKEKLVRYRMFEPLNRIKDFNKRLVTAQAIVKQINDQLRNGKVLGKDKIARMGSANPVKMTLLESLEYVEGQKKLNGHRNGYYRSFKTLRTALEGWLEDNSENDFNLKEFSDKDARTLFEYLRDKKKLSNKTINNYLTTLGIAFRYLDKQYDGTLWKKDPLRNISRLPVVVKRHAAYSDDQVKLMFKKILEAKKSAAVHRAPGYDRLQLFISFIYYLLARPKEILLIKVKDIRLDENRVFISGEQSKNKNDEYVEIAPRLAELIKKSRILKEPSEYYIFSKGGMPGPTSAHENFFWDKHKRVLISSKLLEINPNFTLYSYKHSGAIALYKATKDIKLIQRQCRHKTLEQTNTYLRDLDVLRDYDLLTKFKGAI